MFFVISGFAIMLSALNLQQRHEIGAARRIFFRRRLARIAPLYLVTCMLFIIFIQPGFLLLPVKDLCWQLITHLTFTHNFFPATSGAINGVTWSIGAEFQFYILIMLAMPFLRKISPVQLFAGGISLALVSRLVIFYIAEMQQWGAMIRFIALTQVPPMFDQFSIGMVIAKCIVSEGNEPSIIERLRSSGFWKPFLVTFVSTVFLFLITLLLLKKIPVFYFNLPMVVLWRTLLGFSCGGVLLLAVLLPSVNGCFDFLYRPLFFVGEISYGIYLWHLLVILSLKEAGFHSPVAFSVTVIMLVLILATISWYAIEKPCIRRFRN